MADALSLLRDCNMKYELESIIEQDNVIQLGGFRFQKDINTNHVIWGTDKVGAKEYYTLESILFLLKNVDLQHPQYVRRAAAVDISVVRRPDRKELLAYMNGEVATASGIDKTAPLDMKRQLAPKRPAPPASSINAGEVGGSGDHDVQENNAKKPKLDDQVKVSKRRIDELLDGRKTEKADKPSALKTIFTEEKIAQMKAKAIANRRKNIQSVEESHEYDDADVPVTEENHTEILSRERCWRTRSTVLQSGAKSFGKNVFAILSSIKLKEEGKSNQENLPSMSTSTTAMALAHASANTSKANMMMRRGQPSDGYSRYDQEKFGKSSGQEELVLGFKINTTSTYDHMSLKSVMEGAASKKIPGIKHPGAAAAMAIANSSALKHQQRKQQQMVMKPQKPMKRVSRTPIIIIPAATTSLITLYNAKDMLEDFRFVPSATKRREGMKRENEVLIQRKSHGNTMTVPFRVIDNTSKLQTTDDWDRVVAVFVQGPAWQFKGWPWISSDGSPVEMFSKIQAFHVKFTGQRLEKNVANWNVNVLQLSETMRHGDRAVFRSMWEALDRYMAKYKPHLRNISR